ncbi:MAG: hypothetical protein KDB03_16005 [Planctomycetales bacterium]|nr:hypothetical protein [Planctomycetales bacterium]
MQFPQILRAKQAGIPECSGCHVILPAARIANGFCDMLECTQLQAKYLMLQRRREQEEIRREHEAKAMSLRDAFASEVDGIAEDYVVVLVPYSSRPLEKLTSQRISAFEAHLNDLIQRTLYDSPNSDDLLRPQDSYLPPATDREVPIFAVACRNCGGHCCMAGRNHAFLTVSTLRRLVAAEPTLTEAQMFQMYRGRIPESNMSGSCVFHGQHGCTLPREQRADLCNLFLCRDLQDVRKAIEEGQGKFFIAAHSDQKVEKGEFASIDKHKTAIEENEN